uniref:Uncharacterized protein n=1 Tax=Caenorhabditis japonica TaxID=281687 RepID=A0A8R1I7F8_CAEJA
MSITILNDPQLSSDVYDLLMSRTPTLGSFCEISIPYSRILLSDSNISSQPSFDHNHQRTSSSSYRTDG